MNHLNEIESEPCKVIECTSWPHAKPSQLDLLDLGISLIDFFVYPERLPMTWKL